MTDPYQGREQTRAKHYILKHYLQEFAFKILRFADITYVDGFSGPWQTQAEDFADSSFMIAIRVLQDAQRKVFENTGRRRRIRCFLAESNPAAFALLTQAVVPFHDPAASFEIRTYSGKFEDAVEDIQTFIGISFPLIFIDPTGWTGYPLERIKPLFDRRKCEVLINFMYEFINRFSHSDDPSTVASLAPILGGLDWTERLDPALSRGAAVEKLFRETVKAAGQFAFVVSTKIDKATADRPYFFIAYGTKASAGLKAFRETEYRALRDHVKTLANARDRTREESSDTADLFQGHDAAARQASLDQIIVEHKVLASHDLTERLKRSGSLSFARVVDLLLEAYVLRETNVKDICVELADAGVIQNIWRSRSRKPRDADVIRLKPT